MANFKRTLKQRVKSIIRAARGKNLETLTLGVEIKHCSDCNKISVADKGTAKVKMIECYCCPAEKFCEGNVAKLGCKGVFKLWLEAEENTEPPKPEKPNMFVSDMVDLDQPKPAHIPTPTWNRMRKEFNKIFEDDTDE